MALAIMFLFFVFFLFFLMLKILLYRSSQILLHQLIYICIYLITVYLIRFYDSPSYKIQVPIRSKIQQDLISPNKQ